MRFSHLTLTGLAALLIGCAGPAPIPAEPPTPATVSEPGPDQGTPPGVAPAPVPAVPAAMVTFTLDDSRATDLDWAKPLFDKANVVGALACISGRVGRSGSLNAEQLRAFQAAGWEIMSHSVTHPHLGRGGLTPEQVRQEVRQSRLDLEGLGLRVNLWVTPFGELDQTPEVMAVVRDTYAGSLVATGQLNHPGTLDAYRVHRISIDGHDLGTLRARVDDAVRAGGWAVFVLHSAYPEYNTDAGWQARRQAVAELLAYVAGRQAAGELRVVTPGEGLAALSP